ncbi:LysR family transcriptional regulator [Vibrio sp. CAIM 722]|uniref:LysR family transcriptional regulator n=1 Tax=Vibrio eleionomae TaxID=2653505 RepID=A0A7X4LI03_9VIBR|nr:LysR family transcriptional regulator [Vibrio eleionomae]MZI92011.1 LysR family transcriptional regulator [Vibrio eleionomae]
MFRSLKYFVAVFEELSFSAASKRCFISQPSISSAVAQLESELGCQLFVRHTKGVSPTPEGMQLYPKAKELLFGVGELKSLISLAAPKRQLRLALSPFLGSERVSELVKMLLESVNDLDLTLVDIDEPADARIIPKTQCADSEIFQHLWTDSYVLALPLNHPLTRLETIPLAALNQVPFISRQPCDIDDAWRYAIQKQGMGLNIRATVKTEEYALDLVAAGLGVSVVPSHSVQKRDDVVTRGLRNIELKRVIGLATPRGRALSEDIIQLLTFKR